MRRNKAIIIRYGELGLKGKNRFIFEKQLVTNLELCLDHHNLSYASVERPRGRIIVYLNEQLHTRHIRFLENIPGITSYSLAYIASPNQEDICEAVLYTVSDWLNSNATFRVSVNRADKNFQTASNDLERLLGSKIVEKTQAIVNLTDYMYNVCVDIVGGKAFVFLENKKGNPGMGGLPVGVTGKTAVFVSSENSVETARLMLKRGCEIVLVSDEGYKIESAVNELQKHVCGQKIEFFKIDSLHNLPAALKQKGLDVVAFDASYNRIYKYNDVIKDKDILALFPMAFS